MVIVHGGEVSAPLAIFIRERIVSLVIPNELPCQAMPISQIVADPLLRSCYHLFSRHEIEEYQLLAPDLLLRHARRAPSASLRETPATRSAEFFTSSLAGVTENRCKIGSHFGLNADVF
jgi:hypothetical protein